MSISLGEASTAVKRPPNPPRDDAAVRALDELFTHARNYRTTKSFRALLEFVCRFRTYAPFNAMLVHVQMNGATYVAPPARWLRQYGRRIKSEERPLVILQPMGPVMFVFDVSQTEALDGALALPPEVEKPFEVRGGSVGGELKLTIQNARRDGVQVLKQKAGSQHAGMIRPAAPGRSLSFASSTRRNAKVHAVPLRYEVLLNGDHSREASYATLVHELAHLYCGHLGTPHPRWWPDRRTVTHEVRELEAEAISYLVCRRLGIDTPSEQYLSGYLETGTEMPPLSLDTVLKVAGLIEQMGRGRLSPRKDEQT